MKQLVKISWSRNNTELFIDGKYSRKHLWTFDGGSEIVASSSPDVVPLPYSIENAVDPEEAFVASLSSCHMLFFLSIAASKKFTIEKYIDEAEGILDKNAEGIMMMVSVTLKPKVVFSGNKIPTIEQIDEIHHLAHERCFLASSVRSQLNILPQYLEI